MLAIIGGTGLSQVAGFEAFQSEQLETQYGPSVIYKGEYKGRQVVFLPRHNNSLSVAHKLAPHQINYRANIAALKKCAVSEILSINAVGGINAKAQGGALVIPDQIIDYTYGRAHTFFDGVNAELKHIDFTHPFAEAVRNKIVYVCNKLGYTPLDGGTYGCTQGPRLETAAEIQCLKRDGCDIVGMTAMPEASLAKELGMDYAILSLVVNPAAGILDKIITMADIEAVLSEGIIKIEAIIHAFCQTHP